MQEIFPYTINYNIIPMNTKYKLEDTLEDEKYVNVLLYIIELPFVNLNVNINSFIYCNLINDNDTGINIKDIVKTYIQLKEQLEGCTTTDDINHILNENELFGSSVWLLNDVNNILHNDDTSKFINSNILIKDIKQLSNDELYNKNIMHFVHLNKYIINKLNDGKDNIYSDDELSSFTSTFFNIILKSYKDNNGDNDASEKMQLDNIYNKVMNYYILSKNDTTSSDIDLILSSSYSSIRQDWDTDNVTSSCGCNATSISNNLNTTSCFNIYKQAMLAWLQQMMSDIENFYYKYFTIKSVTDDGKECYNINNDLIDDLLELIKEFKNAGYDLSFSTDINKFRNCNCEIDNSSKTSECNYKTIEDFEKVLYIIKEDKIDENYNKIKLTGKDFATLLDKLYF